MCINVLIRLDSEDFCLHKIFYDFICSQKMNGKCVAGLYIVQISIRRYTLSCFTIMKYLVSSVHPCVPDDACGIGHQAFIHTYMAVE